MIIFAGGVRTLAVVYWFFGMLLLFFWFLRYFNLICFMGWQPWSCFLCLFAVAVRDCLAVIEAIEFIYTGELILRLSRLQSFLWLVLGRVDLSKFLREVHKKGLGWVLEMIWVGSDLARGVFKNSRGDSFLVEWRSILAAWGSLANRRIFRRVDQVHLSMVLRCIVMLLNGIDIILRHHLRSSLLNSLMRIIIRFIWQINGDVLFAQRWYPWRWQLIVVLQRALLWILDLDRPYLFGVLEEARLLLLFILEWILEAIRIFFDRVLVQRDLLLLVSIWFISQPQKEFFVWALHQVVTGWCLVFMGYLVLGISFYWIFTN